MLELLEYARAPRDADHAATEQAPPLPSHHLYLSLHTTHSPPTRPCRKVNNRDHADELVAETARRVVPLLDELMVPEKKPPTPSVLTADARRRLMKAPAAAAPAARHRRLGGGAAEYGGGVARENARTPHPADRAAAAKAEADSDGWCSDFQDD